MSAKIDISPEQLAIVQGILKAHLPKGTLAWAFGSRVTWTAKPFSDLDIALEGAAPLAPDVLIDLEEAFEASDLPWKVDVIDLNAVSPEFRAIVERQRVPADWEGVTLSDVSDPSRKITYGIVQPGQLHSEGVPIVRVNNFRGNSLDLTDRLAVSPEIEAKYRRSRPRPGDLLISLVGSIGQLAIAPPEIEGWNLARAVGLVPFANPAVANWSFYSLQSTASQDFMNQRANTTVQTTFNLKDLARIPIQLPPEWEMERILTTLQALDDKIELNRRMNETLEAMARAVFRDWFVDFGPTRRKAAGLTDPAAILGGLLPDPEKATPLAALFPDSFGEIGLPEGWEERTLADVDLVLESGRRPKGGIDKSLSGGVPSVGAESIYGVGKFDYSKVKYVSEEFAKATSSGWVQDYDVAIYKDGANVGDPDRVALFGAGFPFKRFMVNEHVFLLRSKLIGQAFLYHLMQSHQIADRLEKLGRSKAAQPGLNQREVSSCTFVFPGDDLCEAFNSLVFPWIASGLHNGQENQTLAATRDLLLPKLMSGEIRLTGAEGVV